MLIVRALCLLIFVSLSAYTAPVVLAEPNLFPAFFGAIAGGGWQGQFNLDFLFMLCLSGLYVGWRHRGTPGGLLLGALAFLGGALFLSVYLFVQSFRCDGDLRRLLVG
ncbi:MAG: hypothetical protein RIS17_1353 [Pseudomonadota bacterium]|jgi:hypothetical protein